jgi:hypothetical protein
MSKEVQYTPVNESSARRVSGALYESKKLNEKNLLPEFWRLKIPKEKTIWWNRGYK